MFVACGNYTTYWHTSTLKYSQNLRYCHPTHAYEHWAGSSSSRVYTCMLELCVLLHIYRKPLHGKRHWRQWISLILLCFFSRLIFSAKPIWMYLNHATKLHPPFSHSLEQQPKKKQDRKNLCLSSSINYLYKFNVRTRQAYRINKIYSNVQTFSRKKTHRAVSVFF